VSASVVIVLATYNGAPWLEAQVRSLQAQDHQAWRLLVRDDGSTDGTPALLARLAGEEPRLSVLESPGRLGVVGNFGALLEAGRAAGADYLLPCDQDDVWHPAHVSRALALVRRLEEVHGRAWPLLVHSDVEVVDAALRPLHPSLLGTLGHGHEPDRPLPFLLAQNFVTGCASLANRALLELALPLPPGCPMHDWWLALCAASAGALGFDPTPGVRYRQHGVNQVGAGGLLATYHPLRAAGRRRLAQGWRAGWGTVAQAQALQARLVERGAAAPEVLEQVAAYAGLAGQPPWRRLATLRRLGVRRQRPLGTALLWAQLALADPPGRPARA